MKSTNKTKEQLLKEIELLNIRIAKVEKPETGQMRAEMALRESEEQFKFVSENLQEGVWITDNKDRMIYFNHKMEEISGVSKQDVIGLNVANDFPQETTKHFLPYYQEAKKELKPTFYEARVKTPAGRNTIQSGWLIPKNKDGKYDGMVCTIEDITERKQMEEALKESEKLFSDFFNQGNIGAVISSLKKGFVRTNQKFLDLLGYTEKELKKKTWVEITHPEDLATDVKLHNKLLAGKINNYELDKRFFRKDDSTLYSHITVTCNRNSDGSPKHMLATIQDITEKKKAEEDLKEIFNLSSDMVGVFTTEGNLLKVNPSWGKVLGYTTKELLDIGWAKLVHPDDVEQTNKEVEKQLQGSDVVNFINRFKCKDGSYKTLEWQATYAVEGIVHASARDITERKQAEKEITKQQYYLTKAQEIGSIGTWELDLLKNELIWTDQNYRNFGVPIGTPLTYEIFLNCVHPDDRDFVNTEWMAALIGKAYDIKHRLIVDDQVRWVREKADVSFDKDGKALKAIGFTQDITQRKQVAEALEQNEYFLRESQRATQIGSYKTDFTTGFWKSSEALDKIFGIDSEYSRNVKGWLEIVHPDDREKMAEYLNDHVIAKQKPFDYEYRIERMNDKAIRWVHGLGECKFDEQGNILSMIGTIQDISERKQAEEEIKKSEHLQNMLLNNLPVITLILKKHTREIVACNKLAMNLGAVIGKTCYETLTHCDHSCPFCLAPKLWETNEPQIIEAEYIDRYWEGRWIPFTDDLYLHYIYDITERKQAEEKLKSRNKELEVMNNVTVGRELKMIELKEEINELLEKSGEKPKYKLPV